MGIPTSQGKKKKSIYGWGTNIEISSLSKIKCLQKNVMTPTGNRTEYENYAEGLLMVPGGCWKALQLRAITDLVH